MLDVSNSNLRNLTNFYSDSSHFFYESSSQLVYIFFICI